VSPCFYVSQSLAMNPNHTMEHDAGVWAAKPVYADLSRLRSAGEMGGFGVLQSH